MRFGFTALVWVAIAWIGFVPRSSAAEVSADRVCEISIEPMPLHKALLELAEQCGANVFIPGVGSSLDRIETLAGNFTLQEALRRLLKRTGMTYRIHAGKFIVILPGEREAYAAVQPTVAIPEVLIRGKQTSNVAIVSGDVAPTALVVFRQEQLERSGYSSVGELLTQLLPATPLDRQMIRLQGAPLTSRLVMINGRSLPSVFAGGQPLAPDLYGIPLLDVERIEVLPATASAMYGGGAEGGVINIVHPDNSTGTRIAANYGNDVEAGGKERSLFVSQASDLEDTGTSWSVSAFASEPSRSLSDRSSLTSGRERIAGNNPVFYSRLVPPLGSRTNFRSLDGEPLNGPGSSAFGSVPAGYVANDGADGLLRTAGYEQLAGGARATVAEPSTRYIRADLLHEPSPYASIHANATFTRRSDVQPANIGDYAGFTGALIPASAPNNPFGRDLLVTAPAPSGDVSLRNQVDSLRLSTGLRYALRDNLALNFEYSDFETAMRIQQLEVPSAANDISTGRLNLLADLQGEPLNLSTWPRLTLTTTPTLSSRIATLRLESSAPFGGQRSAALEHRVDAFSGTTQLTPDYSFPAVSTSLSRDFRASDSLSVRRLFPFRLKSHAPFGTGSLDLSVRAERQRSADRTFNVVEPFAAVSFYPRKGISLTSSFSTGARSPSEGELAASSARILRTGAFYDTQRGGEPTSAIRFTSGGDIDLHPERWSVWSTGVALQPDENWSAYIEYQRLSRSHQVLDPGSLLFADFPTFERLFPSRVVRAAPGPGDVYGVGPIVAIDTASTNIDRSVLSTWAAGLQWQVQTPIGQLHWTARSYWIPEFRVRDESLGPTEELSGIGTLTPPRLHATMDRSLRASRWEFGIQTRYVSAYRVSLDPLVIQNQGGRRVSAQLFHDVFVSSYLPSGRHESDEIQIRFDARNVFRKAPAFDAAAVDYSSPYGVGEAAEYRISLRMRF